jgi:hypothetical protein
MRSGPFLGLLGLLLLSSSATARNEEAPVPEPATAPPVLADRIVALVDGDPILLSDLERAIGLGLLGGGAGAEPAAERRRVLDLLIEQRLRYHEIERYGFQEVSVQAIEEQVARQRSRFPDEASFEQRLRELELDGDRLRQLIARQLLTLAFVEERLGPRVMVGLDEIRRYYEESLVPAMRDRGEAAPPLEDVREQIRALLKEQRLNEEIDRWTSELRRAADVVDSLDREPTLPLPPVIPPR